MDQSFFRICKQISGTLLTKVLDFLISEVSELVRCCSRSNQWGHSHQYLVLLTSTTLPLLPTVRVKQVSLGYPYSFLYPKTNAFQYKVPPFHMVLVATWEANCKNQEVLEGRTFTFQNYTEQSLNIYAKCLLITEIFRNHFIVKIISFNICFIWYIHICCLSLTLGVRVNRGFEEESVYVCGFWII